MILVIPDEHLIDPGIDDHALAHRAGVRVFYVITVIFQVNPRKIDGTAQHAFTRGADDGIRLGMHAAAELVAFPARDMHLLADAVAQVDAVSPASRRANISGRNHLVVFDDHRAVALAQTGAALADDIGKVEVVIDFVTSDHE